MMLPDNADPPVVACYGPTDFDGKGREAYYDQRPEVRAAALSGVVRSLERWTSEADKKFAHGWIHEYERHKQKNGRT